MGSTSVVRAELREHGRAVPGCRPGRRGNDRSDPPGPRRLGLALSAVAALWRARGRARRLPGRRRCRILRRCRAPTRDAREGRRDPRSDGLAAVDPERRAARLREGRDRAARMLRALPRPAPDRHGAVSFVQIAVPTRTGMEEFQEMRRQTEEAVGRINGRFGTLEWRPSSTSTVRSRGRSWSPSTPLRMCCGSRLCGMD